MAIGSIGGLGQRPRHRRDHRPAHAARGGAADAAQDARHHARSGRHRLQALNTKVAALATRPADLAEAGGLAPLTATRSTPGRRHRHRRGAGAGGFSFDGRPDRRQPPARVATAVGLDHLRHGADRHAARPADGVGHGRRHRATARSPGSSTRSTTRPARPACGPPPSRSAPTSTGCSRRVRDHRRRRRLHAHRRRRLRPAGRGDRHAPVATPRSRCGGYASSPPRPPTPSPTSCPA